ncbi:hypothetical protein [Myroides sp. WP-1]|uniref:hypothetical protein n=1 Tax=Myroides sp. WP-1 TaxID=2759944 RepID=UPI0015FCD062|nr:hypothetical protein [Myroides sp. WP-1]MBB1139714.1 hypothetical protein [Myroides sp. WP-1]
MKHVFALVSILCLGLSSYAQRPTLIDGRVRLYNGQIIPVKIENKNTKEQTQADQTGYFLIQTSLGDTLRFTSDYSATMLYVIDEGDLQTKRITPVLIKPGQNLEEIVIVKKEFGQGEMEFGGKKMTPAEKRYNRNNRVFSATNDLKMGISIEGIINRLNGTRKRDLKLLEYERIETNMTSFYKQYPREELMKDLGIPEYHVDAFVIYFVTQPETDKIKVDQSEGYQILLAQYYDEFLTFIKGE